MRILVAGGTGLIGSKVVAGLRALGHDAVAASRETGVNTFTTDGLAGALEGVQTVVDVSNSSYLDEDGAIEFFEVSTLNLLTFGRAAGVEHHVALSVVGTERLAKTERGYFRAKFVQEQLIRESGVPHSIVHATQFYEFIRSIAASATDGHRIRVADALIRPMAADDVAATVSRVAVGAPLNRTLEVAGPETYRLADLVRTRLAARADPREVTADPLATYFGNDLYERELLPGADAEIASTRFSDWLAGPHSEDQPRTAPR
jgi:uncharacterized protein YbjT (DUF2867 family)